MSSKRILGAQVAMFVVLVSGCVKTETKEVIQYVSVGDRPLPPPAADGSPSIDAAIFPEIGSTAFLTANDNELVSEGTSNGVHGGYNGGDVLGGRGTFDDAAEAPPSAGAEPMPEPDPTREIVEGDLFKVEGDLVYVLNRYRGLVIIDMSVADQPVVRGRLPFQAVPVEMYVQDGRAYMIISDWFVYWMYDPDADPLGFHGSQILIADVSNPDQPTRLGSVRVDGEVTDTRLVGDVLYAVSKRNPDYWRYNTVDWQDTTWVVSLDIADPNAIHEVDRITFQGTSTLIHVAPHAIFVAATDPNYYLYDAAHAQQTLFTYVDISDPAGDIRERGSIYLEGRITDKFKMDYFDHTFRVIMQDWWTASLGRLDVVDVSYPDDLVKVGALAIDQGVWGSLQATRFSEARAYAMTSRYDYALQRGYYELHSIDLTSPQHPFEAGTLRLDGNVGYFDVRAGNTRLLALGQVWQGSPTYTSRTTLSLYDVSDAAAPALLSEAQLGEGYSSSAATWDYKALKIVDAMQLILLPLTYWDQGFQRYFTGTQLVDWVGDSLDERGRVENIDQVQRAFPVGDRLVAISTSRVQVINAANRDLPVVTAALDLIRNVYDIFDIQGQEVQLVGDVYDGGVKLYVQPFGERDDAAATATLELPFAGAPACFRRGNLIHMIGFEAGAQTIHTADLSDPAHPVLRGELRLAADVERIYSANGSYYYYYWNPMAGLPIDNRILPFTVRRLVEDQSGRRDFDSELRLIDMTDPDNPRVSAAAIPMNEYPFINKVTHGRVLYSTHVEQGTTTAGTTLLYHVRSYVDRIDVADVDHPIVLPSVNVPGWLVDVTDDGQVLFTIDYQWDDFGRRRNSLNALRLDGDVASLMEVLPVSDQVNRAVFRDHSVWLVTHKYPWWGVHADTVESRQPYTVLNRADFGAAGTLGGLTTAKIQGYLFNLLDVDGQLAYLGSSYPYGFVVLDVADASAPVLMNSSRTIGYVSRILVHDQVVYSPLSMFGVWRLPALGQSPPL
ncbi:MAG: beta-propeller domain-containing protein [Deltaproteobacteria bacterium]|nr:beta-propeller domain-containing protein [Deltaproteobacteria bacterium]